MYWIDLLIFFSALPLIGWLAYGFVDSIQHNDGRGIQVYLAIGASGVVILAILVLVGWLSI